MSFKQNLTYCYSEYDSHTLLKLIDQYLIFKWEFQ